jgi:hypothetical protein
LFVPSVTHLSLSTLIHRFGNCFFNLRMCKGYIWGIRELFQYYAMDNSHRNEAFVNQSIVLLQRNTYFYFLFFKIASRKFGNIFQVLLCSTLSTRLTQITSWESRKKYWSLQKSHRFAINLTVSEVNLYICLWTT